VSSSENDAAGKAITKHAVTAEAATGHVATGEIASGTELQGRASPQERAATWEAAATRAWSSGGGRRRGAA
jgi:hypothetical protein